MNTSQRAAAERLADELQRFDGTERESLRDEAAALLRELAAEPVQEPVACTVAGHQYRVTRRMNPGARKVGCDRCRCAWGMHDRTRTFVPWDSSFDAMYAPGGPLDPETYKG